jgi:hypothetical protein
LFISRQEGKSAASICQRTDPGTYVRRPWAVWMLAHNPAAPLAVLEIWTKTTSEDEVES